MVVGFAGLLDLGYFGFFAVGAYTVASADVAGEPADVNLARGCARCRWRSRYMLAGVILGGPTLRLRGDYLAIVTLGFAEMIRLVRGPQRRHPAGSAGHPVDPAPARARSRTASRCSASPTRKPYYWLVLTVIILIVFGVRNLARSRVGRAWVAIREDEDAAEIMGVPTFLFKLWAFAIGAAVGGLAGAMFAGKRASSTPTASSWRTRSWCWPRWCSAAPATSPA